MVQYYQLVCQHEWVKYQKILQANKELQAILFYAQTEIITILQGQVQVIHSFTVRTEQTHTKTKQYIYIAIIYKNLETMEHVAGKCKRS